MSERAIAVIGMGPRGLSVLERLLVRLRATSRRDSGGRRSALPFLRVVDRAGRFGGV
ncbi:hypothetical protein [Spongiactinospora sp. 9N601]|uniref:hypothetical protein n=1 Tax=Spongiactinospora sp. 9N601 TaxID=3375149 RepID=UPI00378F979D